MTNLSVFSFKDKKEVRIQIQKDEPWFCLKDICDVLDIKNTSQLAQQLDVKGICKTYPLTAGGQQQLQFVNEPNLYLRGIAKRSLCHSESNQ